MAALVGSNRWFTAAAFGYVASAADTASGFSARTFEEFHKGASGVNVSKGFNTGGAGWTISIPRKVLMSARSTEFAG